MRRDIPRGTLIINPNPNPNPLLIGLVGSDDVCANCFHVNFTLEFCQMIFQDVKWLFDVLPERKQVHDGVWSWPLGVTNARHAFRK